LRKVRKQGEHDICAMLSGEQDVSAILRQIIM